MGDKVIHLRHKGQARKMLLIATRRAITKDIGGDFAKEGNNETLERIKKNSTLDYIHPTLPMKLSDFCDTDEAEIGSEGAQGLGEQAEAEKPWPAWDDVLKELQASGAIATVTVCTSATGPWPLFHNGVKDSSTVTTLTIHVAGEGRAELQTTSHGSSRQTRFTWPPSGW